jgi:RNA polymerase sigma factor for flagellar operon FliA
VELDDLISVGIIWLIDAIDKYDVTRRNKFKTYAEFRIRGSIMDELRNQDWFPRSIRDKEKKVDRAFVELEQRLRRTADSTEISEELGVDLKAYYALTNKIYAAMMLSIEEINSENESSIHTQLQEKGAEKKWSPVNTIKNKRLNKKLMEKVKFLPKKERIVIVLYYFEDFNLYEISKVLRLTESRISQLHLSGLTLLKGFLDKF